MDDFFWSIRRMCDIVLNNNFGNKALDSLALYVGHDSRVLNAAQPQENKELAENSPTSPVQQAKGASLCNDCVCEDCDSRGEAVECSGKVTE